MSIENPGATKPNKREQFVTKVRGEVDRLVGEGRLTKDQAEEKVASAGLIETGLSDDPEHDARVFAGMGIYSEQELVDLFNEKK